MQDIAKDLIQLASHGDVEAFEEIYQTTSVFVYNTALGITGNTDDAREITQDVFISLFRNLKHFKFKSSLRSWIYRITINTALNFCKRNKKEYRSHTDTCVAQPQFSGQIDCRPEIAIESLLAELNPDQRACILLRHQGLQYSEIAEVLNTNINTVRSRLKRAREALVQSLNKESRKDEITISKFCIDEL